MSFFQVFGDPSEICLGELAADKHDGHYGRNGEEGFHGVSPFIVQKYKFCFICQVVAKLQPSIFAHVENQLLHLLTDRGTVFLMGLKFCDYLNHPRLYLQ